MLRARNYNPAVKHGAKWIPRDIVGGGGLLTSGEVYWVDGSNGADTNDGLDNLSSFATIQAAVTAATRNDVILVRPKAMASGATDPTDYAETVIIPATHDGLSIIGLGGRTQGGLPQIKIGAGSTAMLTVRAPGVTIANLGFNGASSTGGGILLDDDGSTKTAFGWSVINCHFKNCKGATATDASTGGAIQWAATGGAWQGYAGYNRFYKNVGDIVLKNTSESVPQDIVIEHNEFSGPASSTDVNLYLRGAGGSGINGVVIRDNTFSAMPALTSGATKRYVELTGCVGIMANNYFASIVSPTGSEVTFASNGTGGIVPATVFMASNWGETTTTGETGEIFRT